MNQVADVGILNNDDPDDYSRTTAGLPDILHVRLIDEGAFGVVHEVMPHHTTYLIFLP
jgi:hypothetical protein